jgi:tetratricopeptide (TPR) repeat protein
MKVIRFTICVCLFAVGLAHTVQAQNQTGYSSTSVTSGDAIKQPSGLNGPVRRVRAETVTLVVKDGKTVEGPRLVREITTYDQKGQKIDSVVYPAGSSTMVGNKQYLYDAKGNIIEMVSRGDDGSILGKEKYDYQFDDFGNWKMMTASFAVSENGSVSYEPFEITFRTITYYYIQPAPKVTIHPNVSQVANTITMATESGSQKMMEPKSDAPVVAATGRPTSGIKKTSAAADVLEAGRSETPITSSAAVTPKDEAPKLPIIRMSEEAIRKAAIELPQSGNKSTVLSAANATSSEPKTSHTNQAVSEPKIVVQPGDSVQATTTPVNDSPALASSFYAKGSEFLASGRNYEAAQALRQATERDPSDAAAYAKLGIAYVGLQQHELAVAAFKMAIRIKPDAEAYYQLSNAYNGLAKVSQALEALKQAVYIKRAEQASAKVANASRSPSLEDLHYLTGLAYYSLRRYKQAIEELKQVIALNPNRAQAYYGLALTYLANGDRKLAEKQQDTLESLDPVFAAKIAKLLSSRPNDWNIIRDDGKAYRQGFGLVLKPSP